MINKSNHQAGFTLAETMVALFILALVSSAGIALLLGSTSAGKLVRETESEMRRIDIASAMLRNDIANLSTRAIVPDDGFRRPGNLFGGSTRGGEVLRFVRSGWINPGGVEPRSDLQAVAYRLEDGNLIRAATVRPDATRATPVSERILLSGIRDINLSFVRDGQSSADWVGDGGQLLSVLPDLIEIDIIFEDERTLTIAALSGARS